MGVKKKRQSRLMARQKRIVSRAQAAKIGTRARMLVDGPASEHELVLRARLEGQAPDIDPQVYLTECDPETLAAGTFIDAEIVGSREYDLIAKPVSVAHSSR
jgi:tRNA A37 methylthiotransferase MiaB